MEHRAWAEIDLAAIASNVRRIRAHAGDARVLVVVKADAYGHGAVEVARAVVDAGAAFLGVGDSGEAIELRAAGIRAPILVLGSLIPGEIEPVITHDVAVTVHSSQKIQTLAQIGRALKRRPRVHLKIDTGMGRFGALPSRALELLQEIAASDALELEGICTHLAAVDAEDPGARAQLSLFWEIAKEAERRGIRIPYRHAENSLALFHGSDGAFNLIRPGGAVYGILPGSPRGSDLGLTPALTLKSQVVFLKDLPAGAGVGYGRTFVTSRPTRIAILPIGYNDGYRFALGNRGHVLIRGRRAAVAGRISMDYTTVDVTDIPEVSVGDEAVLIGAQAGERIAVGELAAAAGTIPYEILCGLGKRVRRVYRRPPPDSDALRST